MPQAVRQNSCKPADAQISTRGFVVDEDQDQVLQDVSTAMMAIALICEESQERFPELTGEDFAALFRTFGRQVDQVRTAAPFTNRCEARPRDLH